MDVGHGAGKTVLNIWCKSGAYVHHRATGTITNRVTDMAQVTVKYKRNRETRTDGLKAWRVDRTHVIEHKPYMMGCAEVREMTYAYGGVR